MNAQLNTATEAELREALALKNRERNRNSIYNNKVWFHKERDDYGRTIRVVKTMVDGESKTLGVVVCVPRWTKDAEAQHGIKRYFSNDWTVPASAPREESVHQHDKLAEGLARFNCGAKEGELYPIS